ncbi:glycosyltransferase [Laspinema sp. D1]|uniref:Glycosyltransferase n=1 Tax=Laspinema palackyanum D2a TaxID=2953684 RepID=A0ABT2MKD3_9CYAN|nr:glycosyltransferase [Laspinema sp. D2a]
MSSKFSVIIPTRQRHNTLQYAIQSVLNQTYQDFEVVVMDNYSTPETREVVDSFNNSKIKYYRAPQRLSMSDNWELGLSHATGEYVIIIGDDDGLLPDGLEIGYKLLDQYKINQVTWFRHPYYWPNAIQTWEQNRLHILLNKNCLVANSKEQLKLFYQGKTTYEFLPMLYNSFIHRDIIKKIREKQEDGRYFLPTCLCPDIYSGIVNAYFTESYLYTERPLSISGISGHSTGISFAFPGLNSQPAQEFVVEQQSKNHQFIHRDLVPSKNSVIVIASDQLTIKDFFFKNEPHYQLNIEALLSRLISQINNNPQEYEQSLAEIHQLAQKWNINLSQFKIPPKAEPLKQSYEGYVRNREGGLMALVVDCQKLDISTVDQAALLCSKIINEEIPYKNHRGEYYIDPNLVKSSMARGETTRRNSGEEATMDLQNFNREKLVQAIASLQVKQRVYAILTQLTSDRWMQSDLERYADPSQTNAGWFDSISFLNWYAHNFKPKHYLEVGVRRGRSLAQVLAESPQTQAYGFDLWIDNYAGVANPGPDFVCSELRKLGIQNLPTLISGNSHQTLPNFFADPRQIQEFDLINIDGDHSYSGAKEDLEIAFAHLATGGALMFDDITHPAHPELRELWDEYREKFKDYLFIEDAFGTGTGVAFKPPFTQLSTGIDSVSQNETPPNPSELASLPIHFFTIVLNGEPFIRYHIEVFKNLPFQWHWHIVEGVADLKQDTAWSLRSGGKIEDEMHRQGRSKDGTTEYLNQLARLYPQQVTLYQKPEGVFWDGKREMVNAPLANIQEECLLWQVDVDELWTVEQIATARQMFIKNPEKTAAFYWCWYFVGDNLAIATRNCYTQNPQQEWLRSWRFKPGMRWLSHEPPRLAEPLANGEWRDVGRVNPFRHEETEQQNLVFQHFAYVTIDQLCFKEKYYGYPNALNNWIELQKQTQFPLRLRDYFSWVQDDTIVNKATDLGIVPLAKPTVQFVPGDRSLGNTPTQTPRNFPFILIDGVFYQINNTGIARVWTSLLQEWVKTGFAKQLLFLDRAGTAPRIPGIKYLCIPTYDYHNTEADRLLLQDICDEEGADIFISTYYTTPISTPSVFMAYDMIPERYSTNLNSPMWREKHHGIRQGSAYLTISEQTARDLVEFFPEIPRDRVTVAPCGIQPEFRPTTPAEVTAFKAKYRLSKPYFLWVGSRTNINQYKNAILFFQAFAQLPNRQAFDILCVGGEAQLEPEFQTYVTDTTVHFLKLSDSELRLAYSGATALIYTSKYEGFGLPVLEAMACGCPVITCPNGAIPEVGGSGVMYVQDHDISGLVKAMQEIQKPEVRNPLIAAGLERPRQFSWEKMAEIVRSTLVKTAQNPRKAAIATPASPTPVEPGTLTHLQQTRQQLAQQWLNTPEEQLQSAYLGELGTAHKALLESGIKHHALTPSEQGVIRQLSEGIAQGFDAPNALQSFIAATLYCYPHQLQIPYTNAPIPKWFAQDYLKFMFASPTLFHELGEVAQYYRYFQGWVEYVHQKIFSNPDSPLWQSVAEFFTQGNANFAPLYFTRANLKSVYSQRAEIIEFALKNRQFPVDYVFSPRSANRPKIRLGILRDHFKPATETLATLPVFEHLDRQQFEIVLYANQVNGSQLEWYCQSRADRLVKLPETLSEQVQTLRNDDLDILFIGTNITELNHSLTALAQHRLARVQVTSIASPVTTGIRNIDYYIAGNLTAPTNTSSEQYREKLVNIEGSGLCFRFPLPEPASTVNPTRASWGATEQTVVFMSGANFYKIIPELTETWAKILAVVPHSILVLYPFGPAWNSTYPAMPFLERLHRIFTQHGIDKRRLILINTLPSPSDIKECVKLADVYLDSYPYSGATSLLDPLQLGIPAIAWEDNSLRSRQASALLREIHLSDLIAQDEPGYIQLAIKLATNPQFRHHYRQQIQQQMQQNPPFLDSAAYGQKMGHLFEQLVQGGQTSGAMASAKPTQSPSQPVSVSQEFLNRLIGCANLYYIDPSDESIQRELLQLRREFAELWLQIPSDRLHECYTQELGKAHQSVLNSGIQNQPLPETEQRFVQELKTKLVPGLDAPLGMNAVLALLLYQQRDRLPLSNQPLPDWVNG